MEIAKVIATNIAHLLETKGLTQAELSSHLGISRQTLANYLKGSSTIDSVRLLKTANFFNVPVSTLLEAQNVVRKPFLFRATPAIKQYEDLVETKVFDYIRRYEAVFSSNREASCFTPEQYDLRIEYNGQRVSVNYELNRFPSTRFIIDKSLHSEIWNIADMQRKLLGLNDAGAIELISALNSKGIKIIFMQFSVPELFGVSVCDMTHGCYIFVNSDPDITIERQLFTIAHEYAHLILHRPLFNDAAQQPMSSLYSDLLEKMANLFAGRLICPAAVLYPYAGEFSTADSTLRSILFPVIRLKHRLNISMGSLIYALKSYGMISRSVESEFYSYYNSKEEPYPLKDVPVLYQSFIAAKSNHIIDNLRSAFIHGEHITEEDIVYFTDCDLESASKVLRQFHEENDQAYSSNN